MAHKLVTSFSYAFSENIDLHHLVIILVIIDPRLKYAGMTVGATCEDDSRGPNSRASCEDDGRGCSYENDGRDCSTRVAIGVAVRARMAIGDSTGMMCFFGENKSYV